MLDIRAGGTLHVWVYGHEGNAPVHRFVDPLRRRVARRVPRGARALDAEVRRFHWRRLDDEVRSLLLGGVTMRVKHPGRVKRKLVLVAYGIRPDGTRVLLDFRLATAESAAQWEAFLEDLFRRELEGTQLRLVVTDGCPGLYADLAIVYPRVPRQACWAHNPPDELLPEQRELRKGHVRRREPPEPALEPDPTGCFSTSFLTLPILPRPRVLKVPAHDHAGERGIAHARSFSTLPQLGRVLPRQAERDLLDLRACDARAGRPRAAIS